MDMKLEVVVVPVSDVDRAKQFYKTLGWRLDADFITSEDFRVVQLTPPGSESRRPAPNSSVTASTSASPSTTWVGSSTMPGLRDGRPARIRNIPTMARSPRSVARTATTGCSKRRRRGLPDGDRDANDRREGHPMDVATLTDLLREAEEHHGPYEATAPEHHWSGWYAAYIIAREHGRSPEEAIKAATTNIEGARS